jgi:enoyl-CoA hydratase/carnithine racemase
LTEPSFETLDVDRTEGIATITIQGVNELNALNQRTTDELSTVTADLSEDDDIRCLVLTGGSNAFGGGADLGHLTGSADDAMAVR